MYVIAHHHISAPEAAGERAQTLINGEGAPPNTRVLQVYPSRDLSLVTCLWESDSVQAVQDYVDTVLGDSSRNNAYEVLAEQAFAEQPAGLPAAPQG